MKNPYLIFAVTVILLILTGLMNYYLSIPSQKENVSNYAECVKANNLVLETYPAQCRTPKGKTFTQPLSDEEKKKLVPPTEEKTCKNTCGDGVCQEIVCTSIGCPCPESPQSCPNDCK